MTSCITKLQLYLTHCNFGSLTEITYKYTKPYTQASNVKRQAQTSSVRRQAQTSSVKGFRWEACSSIQGRWPSFMQVANVKTNGQHGYPVSTHKSSPSLSAHSMLSLGSTEALSSCRVANARINVACQMSITITPDTSPSYNPAWIAAPIATACIHSVRLAKS